MIGLGTDILKLSRMENILNDKLALNSFLNKTYTKKELLLIEKSSNPLHRYASHFCAKEAVFKSFGLDSNISFHWSDIEILYHNTGQPYVVLHNNMLKIKEDMNVKNIFLSISYDTDYVVAFAGIE